jgi:hypothetical protein
MRRRKCGADSILYMAIAAGTDLWSPRLGQKLYVGSQSGIDRMFRGDGLKGQNFHHAEMRNGNNGQGLINYLTSGRQVDIFQIDSTKLVELTETVPRFLRLVPMARGIVTLPMGRNYAGYWFEQLILREERNQWAWNSQGIQAEAQQVFATHGV